MKEYSTDERLQQETLCRRQWTAGCVERPERDMLMRRNVVVVWIQWLMVDVVRHTDPLAPGRGLVRMTSNICIMKNYSVNSL